LLFERAREISENPGRFTTSVIASDIVVGAHDAIADFSTGFLRFEPR